MPPPDTCNSRQSPKARRFQVKWVVLYAQATKIATQRVHFPGVSFLRPFRGEGVLPPSTILLVSGHFADRPSLLPISKIRIRAPKPGGSRLNGSFYMPKPPKSRHSVFIFGGSPLSVPFVVRGFRHHFNQQPTAFKAHFADRPCLLPIPKIPFRAPKQAGSRLNGSF
jgi:hypothetical protein